MEGMRLYFELWQSTQWKMAAKTVLQRRIRYDTIRYDILYLRVPKSWRIAILIYRTERKTTRSTGQCIPLPRHVLPVFSIRIRISFWIRDPDRYQNLFNHLFIGPLLTFPANFMPIRLEDSFCTKLLKPWFHVKKIILKNFRVARNHVWNEIKLFQRLK